MSTIKVPQLRKKKRHDIDPDSLAAALNWDKLADPGDGWNQVEPEKAPTQQEKA